MKQNNYQWLSPSRIVALCGTCGNGHCTCGIGPPLSSQPSKVCVICGYVGGRNPVCLHCKDWIDNTGITYSGANTVPAVGTIYYDTASRNISIAGGNGHWDSLQGLTEGVDIPQYVLKKTCTDCKGTGEYVGFVARSKCKACGGIGRK